VALYLFDEGAGNRVRNAFGTTAPLIIPDHPAFQREVLDQPLINKYNRLSYVKDGVVNILGFVPFGFFLSLWMIKTGRWSRGTIILIAVGLGALVSLTIELIQVFIPVRDSSLMDLVCNTFGTLIGARVWVFAGSSKVIRI
jgi:glycopeptide antibiotics resistance protein